MVREPTRERAVTIHRTMHLIRAFEERVAERFAAAEIPAFIHLAVGQESAPTTVCAVVGANPPSPWEPRRPHVRGERG